VFPGM